MFKILFETRLSFAGKSSESTRWRAPPARAATAGHGSALGPGPPSTDIITLSFTGADTPCIDIPAAPGGDLWAETGPRPSAV